MRRAVFLDRDGVLNALVYRPDEGVWDSPYTLAEFALLPRAAEAVRLLNGLGFVTAVVSNQPGVAKGKCDEALLETLTEELYRQLRDGGAVLDHITYCKHHPDAVLDSYRVRCACRKPRPGLLAETARELKLDLARSYMIGDTDRDILAGQAAGCKTILVRSRGTPAELPVEPDLIAADLLDAVHAIAQGEV